MSRKRGALEKNSAWWRERIFNEKWDDLEHITQPNRGMLARIEAINELFETFSPRNNRDIYYRLRTKGVVPKGRKGILKIGYAIKVGVAAGLIDEGDLEDASGRAARNPLNLWDDTDQLYDALGHAISHARLDFWPGQPRRLEIWCEKHGTVGRVHQVASPFCVPVVPMGGQGGDRAMKANAKRIRDAEHPTLILYIGDLDPHGIHIEVIAHVKAMMWSGREDLGWKRIGITSKQARTWDLDTEPTELREDGRDERVVERFHNMFPELGGDQVEVEALDVPELRALVKAEIEDHIDLAAQKRTVRQQIGERKRIKSLGAHLAKWKK